MTNMGGLEWIGMLMFFAGATLSGAILTTAALGVSLATAVVVSWLTDVEFYLSALVSGLVALIALLGLTPVLVGTDQIWTILWALAVGEIIVGVVLVILPIGLAGLFVRRSTDLDWSRATHVPAIGWVLGFSGPALLATIVAVLAGLSGGSGLVIALVLFGLGFVTTPVGILVAVVLRTRIAAVVDATSPHWGRPLLQSAVGSK